MARFDELEALFLIVRPGDAVLFKMNDDADPDHLEEFARHVRRLWPNIPIVVAQGDFEVTVVNAR